MEDALLLQVKGVIGPMIAPVENPFDGDAISGM